MLDDTDKRDAAMTEKIVGAIADSDAAAAGATDVRWNGLTADQVAGELGID